MIDLAALHALLALRAAEPLGERAAAREARRSGRNVVDRGRDSAKGVPPHDETPLAIVVGAKDGRCGAARTELRGVVALDTDDAEPQCDEDEARAVHPWSGPSPEVGRRGKQDDAQR
jgi:hypothetical protein